MNQLNDKSKPGNDEAAPLGQDARRPVDRLLDGIMESIETRLADLNPVRRRLTYSIRSTSEIPYNGGEMTKNDLTSLTSDNRDLLGELEAVLRLHVGELGSRETAPQTPAQGRELGIYLRDVLTGPLGLLQLAILSDQASWVFDCLKEAEIKKLFGELGMTSPAVGAPEPYRRWLEGFLEGLNWEHQSALEAG